MKQTFTKVLSIVLALAMCMSTFAMLGVSAATTCDHTNPTEETATYYGYQNATCTEMGGHMWKCKTCGEEFATEVKAPLGHDTTGPDATCQNAKVCARCDVVLEAKKAHSPKLDEKGKAIVYTKAADCTTGTEGYTYNVCKWCGKEINIKDKVSGDHKMDYTKGTVIKAPTCTENGEMKFVCQNKGCTYEEIVRINAEGHKFGALVAAKVPATCDTEYLKDHYRCTVCEGYFDTAYKATTKAALTVKTAHLDKNTLIQTIAGTCTAKAAEKHFCEVCEKNWTVEKDYFHATVATHTTAATCTKYGYTYKICQLCGQQVGKTEILDPTGHSKKIGDVVAATCTEGSYQLWECTYTNEENHANGQYKEYLSTALGHTPVLYKEAVPSTCGKQGTAAVYRCERYDVCGYETVGERPAPVDHKFVSKTYAPTCMTEGYTIEECEMCGTPKDGKKTNIVAKDPAAHVLSKEPVVLVPAQCGVQGITAVKYCTLCDKADEIIYVDALVHNYSKYERTIAELTCKTAKRDVYSCSNTWVDPVTGKTVTCGHTMTVNTYFSSITPDQFENLDEYREVIAAAHEAEMAARGKEPVAIQILRPGTCMVRELVLYACTSCQKQYEKNMDYGHASTDEFPTHTPALDSVGLAANCATETDGYKAGAYYCVECTKANNGVKVWWKGEAPETIKFAHNEKGEVKAVKPTCETVGNEAFKYCTVCEAAATKGPNAKDKILAKKILPADGHKDVLKAEVPATCGRPEAATGTTGMKAHRFCDVCDTYFAVELDKDGKPVKLNQNEIDALVIPALTHNYVENKVVVKFVDCTKISYVYYECTLCGDQYVNTFVDEAAHKWGTGVVTPATCTTAGYTTYTCTVCSKTAKNVKEGDAVPALKHYNKADNKTFVGLCTENLTDKDTYVCNRENCPDKGVVTIKHNNKAVSKVVPATCTLPGYTIYICADCEKSFLEDYTALAAHTPVVDEKQSYAATYTTKGLEVKVCKVCNVELSRKELPVIAGVKVTITADSAIKEGFNLVNGGKVQFTVAISTNKVMANNLSVKFHYSNNLEFDSIEFAGVFGESEQQFYYANNGVLNVSSWAPNTTDKQLQDLTISGENVVYAVITFTIADDAAYENATLTADPIALTNIKGESAGTSAVATCTKAISMLGNADGINMSTVPYFSANDALTIRTMMVEGAKVTYSAEADIDMDGDVDGDDFILLNRALVEEINPLVAAKKYADK